jgi:hypothetical protein
MKSFLLKVFTWWNSQTFGTQLWTWRFGEQVGEDEFGNRYYRTRGGKIDPTLLFERRWVIYNGYRGLDRAAVLAWLVASHGRYAAHCGKLQAASLAEAPQAESHGDPGRLPSAGFDFGGRPPSACDRRLQSLGAGGVAAGRGE